MKEKDKATNTGRMDEGKREKKKRRAKISPSCFVSKNSATTTATLRTYWPLLVIFEERFYQVEIIWLDQSLDVFQYGGISFFWLLNFLSNILNFNRIITLNQNC